MIGVSMKTGIRLLTTCAAALAICGCGGGGGGMSAREAVGRSVLPVQSLPGLTVTVKTSKTEYRVGETIPITVSITSTDRDPKLVKYSTGSPAVRWGYIIARDNKIVTYEFWEGRRVFFTTDIGMERFSPGETKEYASEFPLKIGGESAPAETLPPGTYQIYARLSPWVISGLPRPQTGDPVPVSEPITITVTP